MFSSMRFRGIALGLVLLGAVGVSRAEAAEVSVAATDATVTMVNGIVNAQFRIAATNLEAADATGVTVTFADGAQVVVGDVLAGATATSALETRTYDASATPTRSQTLQVTLKYTLGGQAIEQPAVISLRVQE